VRRKEPFSFDLKGENGVRVGFMVVGEVDLVANF
jgi:hypothetical protein